MPLRRTYSYAAKKKLQTEFFFDRPEIYFPFGRVRRHSPLRYRAAVITYFFVLTFPSQKIRGSATSKISHFIVNKEKGKIDQRK